MAAQGPTAVKILAPSVCDDTLALAEALTQIGIRIDRDHLSWTVHGCGGALPPFHGQLNLGAGGTGLRFLLPLLCFSPGVKARLDGSKRMRERPIAPLLGALTSLGAKLKFHEGQPRLPLEIEGQSPSANLVQIDAEHSSQFLSALLLFAPLFPDGLRIELLSKLASSSYAELTLEIMRAFGLRVISAGNTYSVSAPIEWKVEPWEFAVEPDASSAAYFFALSAISRTPLSIKDLSPRSLQADIKILGLLELMGCRVLEQDGLQIEAPKILRPIEADLSRMPDQALTMAVLASTVPGVSRLTGLQTLRHKESDRLAALKSELEKCGIQVEINHNSAVIYGGNPKSARIATFDDHRMAMAFSLLCFHTGTIEIENPAVVSKSFPDYWQELRKLGVETV